MKLHFLFTFLILNSGLLYGQKKQCHCESDTLMNNATVDCATRILKNKSKLYWQFNCNKIWLTLETIKGQKITIDEVPVGLYGYTYRLGFRFVKEFDRSILFSYGCPANGPCVYALINKTTGKKTAAFGQLICIDTQNEKDYPFNFLVYADSSYKKIIVNFPDKKQIINVPFDFQKIFPNTANPEYRFENMALKGNILTLYYKNSKDKKLNFKINFK